MNNISIWMEPYSCIEAAIGSSYKDKLTCAKPPEYLVHYKGSWPGEEGVYWCADHYAKFHEVSGYTLVARINSAIS